MADGSTPLKVVWTPQPGSQVLSLSCPAQDILYDGTRGPGKTDAQLMDFRKNVGIGYGPFWRGALFDQQYKNLDDIVTKSKRWFYSFGDGARFIGGGVYKWVWPTGEELLLRIGKSEEDYWDYHGQEFPWLGYNELTKYAKPDFKDAMDSCNRSSFRPQDYPVRRPDGSTFLLPMIPLRQFSTTNPFGPGRNWVKKRYVDPAPAGKIITAVTKVYNPQSEKVEEIATTRCRIFGSYKENKYLDPKYIAKLTQMKNKNRRKAWLFGDWNVASGGCFDDLWDDDIHIIERFPIPATWYVDRALDWGSSKPFSVGWWAEANGEEVLAIGRDGKPFKWAPPRGTLIRIAEWYGTEDVGTNEGINLGSKAVARGVKEREKILIDQKWCRHVVPGPADNSIGAVIDKESTNVRDNMISEGVYWTASDKSPGSRSIGYQLFRDRLENSLTKEGPGVYVMRCCPAFIELIPNLPRDPKGLDDVDTDAEDHTWDETRYRMLNAKRELKRTALKM